MNWHEFLMQSASIVTAFATVGGAMLWAYKKLVIEPDQRVAEEVQRKNTQELKKAIQPLSRSIELLNHNLEESKKETKRLYELTEKHEIILHDHERRISILEDWRKTSMKLVNSRSENNEGNQGYF